MADEEFEVLYEGRCQCGDEGLDWEWVQDELCFCATCTCFKRHLLTPTAATTEVELNGDEADIEADQEEWE